MSHEASTDDKNNDASVSSSPAEFGAAAAPFEEVSKVLYSYFDGLYHCDTEILKNVFHPSAIYATATDGTLLTRTMQEYLPIVAKRVSPASQKEQRRDRIISIDFAGPVTAVARVECSINPKDFVDILTLVKVDGRFQIISKVFHFTIRDTK